MNTELLECFCMQHFVCDTASVMDCFSKYLTLNLFANMSNDDFKVSNQLLRFYIKDDPKFYFASCKSTRKLDTVSMHIMINKLFSL